MKNILVTGGAGFIGSTLCERLLHMNYKIINIDNFDDYYNPALKWMNVAHAWLEPAYRLVKADIRNVVQMEEVFRNNQIDAVVHLAALAGVRNSIVKPAEYSDVDITGTINMLECARKYGVKKFVFASSSSVYGSCKAPFAEDARTDLQLSPYAAAKYAGEQFCRVYSKLFGLSVVCLRFFTVYGERQRPEMAIHKLTRQLDCGQELQIYGNGKSYRDYTHVSDIINGIIASIQLECEFEIINLGSENEIMLIDLVRLLGEKMNKPLKIRHVDPQQGDVEGTRADLSKAKELLGYRPQMDFETGINRFVEWYKENRLILSCRVMEEHY